jgi:hypothetical protein
MKIIRASELGTYVFCNRAWWYQLQGYEPDDREALIKGKQYHEQHSNRVTSAGCLLVAAYGLVLIAIITTIIWLIQTHL